VNLGKNLLVVIVGLVGATMFAALPAAAQQKPNVVFILADNVGYGDMASYAANCGECLLRAWTV
jgi:basic membrane lipoprotein Med (substrate-binding protein (PBP1-ABC) superfamily)